MIEINQFSFFSGKQADIFYNTLYNAGYDTDTVTKIEEIIRKSLCSHKQWLELYGIYVHPSKKIEIEYIPRHTFWEHTDVKSIYTIDFEELKTWL